MSEFPNPEESPFEHPNGNTYVWNGWAWEIEGKSNDYATEEYVDDATTQTLKDSKAYTDEKIAEGVADGKRDLESYLTIEDANLTFDDLYDTKANKDYVEQKIAEEHQHSIDGDAELDRKLNEEAAARKKADDELQQAVDRVEGVTHRAEWYLRPVAAGDPLNPGEMSFRDPGAQGWAGVLQVRIHHEDLGGRVHPMGTIQSGNLWMVEWADDQDVIQGSAVYIVGTIRSNSEWIDFDPASMVHASGQPPALDAGEVMKMVFTPADSGSSDYWTKAESDNRYLAKGTSTNLQLNNGSTLAQSTFSQKGHTHSNYLAKGNSTDLQLNNGSTLEQSTFSKTGHTHSGYASSSHSHSGYASSSHSHSSYISKTNNNKKILQADGTIGSVTFTKNGTALYWE